MSNLRFALIGPGRVGTALANLLRSKGYILAAVVGRSQTSLQRAQGYLQGGGNPVPPEFTTDLLRLPPDLDFILLGVRDDQIAGVVETLGQRKLLRPKQVLIHLSGTQPSDVSQSPHITEIARLALHPLQAVADIDAGIAQLTHCVWSVEGDVEAVSLGEALLSALGVRWLRITKDQKTLYHAAACIASNYLVTIAEAAQQMLTKVGFPEELAAEALQPLIEGTVENLRSKRPVAALTGPIARGDAGTVEKHLQAIRESTPDLLPLYTILGNATLQFARLDNNKALIASLFNREMEAFTQSLPKKEED